MFFLAVTNSDELEEALTAPLPIGLAPQKPPRMSSLLTNEVGGNTVKNKTPYIIF